MKEFLKWGAVIVLAVLVFTLTIGVGVRILDWLLTPIGF